MKRSKVVPWAWASVPAFVVAGLLTQAAGCGKPAAPKDGPKPADKSPGLFGANLTPAEREQREKERQAKALREVAGHRYWKVKLAEADVERMADAIAAEKGTSAVFIDDAGKTAVVKDAPDGGLQGLRPEGIGQRRFIIDLNRAFAKRPTRAEVIDHLRVCLDAAEYRD